LFLVLGLVLVLGGSGFGLGLGLGSGLGFGLGCASHQPTPTFRNLQYTHSEQGQMQFNLFKRTITCSARRVTHIFASCIICACRNPSLLGRYKG
jgi:hypothetical protein